MSCVGVKTAADSNDITESLHDVKPTIGVLGFLIFIHFSRKETSNDSGVAHHAHVLRLHAEVHLLCA